MHDEPRPTACPPRTRTCNACAIDLTARNEQLRAAKVDPERQIAVSAQVIHDLATENVQPTHHIACERGRPQPTPERT
ncbi:hypothetical protein ACTWPB_07855 [Nocardia sp. IBHARD005]|uniref:hypothetical protein n=1 Tax=Nocardia sp. IBHARD005 TaxID=3457765 RepID=UPI00405884F9